MIPKFKKPKPTNEDQPKEKQTMLHPTYYWYENGKIWKYSSRDSRGLPVKFIEYDEIGNIIRRIEYK